MIPETLAPASHCAWQSVDGEIIVIDLKSRVVQGLNPVASAVWTMLDGRTAVSAIAQRIAEVFPAHQNAQAIQSDIVKFLENLWEKGLVCEAGSEQR